MTQKNATIAAIFIGSVLFSSVPQVASAETPSEHGVGAAPAVSNICLMPIPGTGADVLGFAVGNMIEAPKGSGVLIDTVDGLFHQRLDGSIESLQPRTGQYTRALAALPWSDEIIAVGASETVIHQDLSVNEIYRQQNSELLGVFPSIQSAFLKTERVTGSNPFFGETISDFIEAINASDGKYRLVTSNSEVADIDFYTNFIVDAPWFGTPIVWTDSGPFSIDREGILRKFDLEEFPGGTLNFGQQFFSVPRFRTLYVRIRRWFRISPNRQWAQIQGLPADTIVFTSFDPGSGDVLFATTEGIFTVSPDGAAHALTGNTTPRHSVYALAQDPSSEFVLAGGDDGLFRVKNGSLGMVSLPNGSATIIGSVKQIVPVKFANFDLVVTSKGTYSFKNGKLEVIPALAPSSKYDAPSPVFVLPRIQRALVSRRNEVGPMIYELRRSGPDGKCEMPLASNQAR